VHDSEDCNANAVEYFGQKCLANLLEDETEEKKTHKEVDKRGKVNALNRGYGRYL